MTTSEPQERNWDNCQETLDESLNWASKNPLIASMLAIGAARLVSGAVSKFRNRKGNKLFLEIDLSKLILKEKPVEAMVRLFEKDLVYYRDILDALDMAAKDSAVAGIIVKIGSIHHIGNLSTIWELRQAVIRLKAAGKKTIVFAESFGEAGENIFMYYLASCFQEIHLPRSVSLPINGIVMTGLFLKQLIHDKLDIDIQILQREGYKNAANLIHEDKLTPEHREHLERHQAYLLDLITREIAEDRGMTIESFNELMNKGFFTAAQACERNLITHVGYRDSAYGSAALHVSTKVEKLNLMFIPEYARRFGQKYKSFRNFIPWTNKIAIVHLSGSIMPGYGEPGEGGIHSDNVARTLRALRKEKRIQAVILHINSPGGSATASDTILREIDRLKEVGKKIVVFQSAVAASGGYWISLPADAVVSTPLTVTGSIGVIFGKLNLRGMWKKIGVTFDSIDQKHELSDFWSNLHSWDEKSLTQANKLIDQYYELFKDLVAERRNLPRDVIDEIAQGKVYFGNEALELKLIDHVGGIEKAIEVAKNLIGLSKDDFAQVTNYPPQPSIVQLVMRSILGLGDKGRNSDEQDEFRRRGLQTQTIFNYMYQQFSVVPHVRRVSGVLFGNRSSSQVHHELSIMQNSMMCGESSTGIEAFAANAPLFSL